MSGWKAAVLLLCTGVLWVMLSILAERVAWIQPPTYVSAESDVIYAIRVPRHAENRRLEVAAFAGDLRVTHTQRDLHGLASPALYNVKWRLEAGTYLLIAAVFDTEGEAARDVHGVTVVGGP